MTEIPEAWWTVVQAELATLLHTLDEHNEPLIAAHVAMALESLQTRIPILKTGS